MSTWSCYCLLLLFVAVSCLGSQASAKRKQPHRRHKNSPLVAAKRTDGSAGSISWERYCACLNVAASEGINDLVKNCFRDFFREPTVKAIRKRMAPRKVECFEARHDADADCQVIRKWELSRMFKTDIKALKSDVSMRIVLYTFWRAHPDILEVCHTSTNALFIAGLIVELSAVTLAQLKTGNSKVTQLSQVIGDVPLGAELTEQVYRVCYRSTGQVSSGSDSYKATKGNFCDLDFTKTMVRKMNKFTTEAKIDGKWTDSKLSSLYNGLRLNFVAWAEYIPDRYGVGEPFALDTSANERENGYKINVNRIIELVEARDFPQLKMLTDFFPDDILVCSGTAVETTEACYFKKILDQLVLHFKVSDVSINGKQRKLLSTDTNYGDLLRFNQMSEILRVVQTSQFMTINLAEDITDSNNQRFGELRKYFVDLQSFNQDKAQADITFIDDWITKYSASVTSLARTNGHSLRMLLEALDTGVKLDILEKAAQMALSIAEACNPLKTMFGGSSLGDIVSATAEWTVTMGKLGISDALKAKLQEVIDKTTSLAVKFSTNGDAINDVVNLVKSTTPADDIKFETQKRNFITMYSAYNPEVKRPELEEMTALWTGMVAAACEVIAGFTGAAATIAVGNVNRAGTCWKMPVSITKMMTTYLEIYDFQFDLMETLASSMRAKIAKREASAIAGNFVSFPERETDDSRKWRSIYTLSYLTYKMQTWNNVELHCDKIQYREGGIRPDKCLGEMTNVPLLMARPGKFCTEIDSDDVRIPTKPSAPGDTAFVNLTNLYLGEDVPFQIKDSEWLVQNKWLTQKQTAKAMYMIRIELFLPTVSGDSVRLVTGAQSVGENVLHPCESCTSYILSNQEKSSSFDEGYEASCDDDDQFKNPYTICNSEPLPKLCRRTKIRDQPPGTLNPSVYALWKFNIDGYQATPQPDVGNTDMYIRAKIKFCLMNSPPANKKSASKRSRISRKCCTGNKYFSSDADACTDCPDGVPHLNGYYCEKNEEAVMAD